MIILTSVIKQTDSVHWYASYDNLINFFLPS